MPADLTRRELVKRALVVLPAIPIVGAALGSCARLLSDARRISMPAPDRRGNATLGKSLVPELAATGGAVVLHFPIESNWRPALLANAGSGFVSMQGDCPHEACDLTWVQSDREIECPCHGSRFAADGTLLNPPAAVDLEAFTIEDAGDHFIVHMAPGDGFYPEPAADGSLTVNLASYPALANAGGSVSGWPEGLFGPLILVREDASTIAALSAVCPHMGCYVQRQGGDFHCPCHGSTFHLNGSFVPDSGPANSKLPSFTVKSFDPATGVLVVQIL